MKLSNKRQSAVKQKRTLKAKKVNKIQKDSDPINLFTKLNKCKSRSVFPKKENLNILMARGIIRMYRHISKGRNPNKTCVKIDPTCLIFKQFLDLYNENKPFIEGMIKHENWPKYKDPNSRFKSFSTKFLRFFYESEVMQQSFYLIVRHLMEDIDPQTRCEKFNFRCCEEEEHDEIKCGGKWNDLNNYLLYSYLNELKVKVVVRDSLTMSGLDFDSPKNEFFLWENSTIFH